MELAIQKYLRNGKTPDDLLSTYDIHFKRHSEYSNLILFKYGIDTPMSEQLSREARGIILDESKNWEVVCYSYSRFFNHYEGLAAEIDWSSAKVMEKLDGSIMQVFWYDGKWQVASSGLPDALGQVSDFNLTFKDLFWQTWETLRYRLPIWTQLSYAFELITKYNRIICRYPESRIVLHGVRNLVTLSEVFPEPIAGLHKWACVKTYPLQTFKEVVDFVKEFDPMTNEGCVICDQGFNRIKIKSPQYVALANIRGGLSTKRLIEIVRMGENSEFLSYFPEFTKEYEEVKEKYEKLTKHIYDVYWQVKDIESQKEFALTIKHLPFSGILFQMRKTSWKTVKELLAESRLDYVVDLLKA